MTTNRLTTMAALLACPPEALAGFLDFIAEEEMTDRRVTAGQYILGLPTPVFGYLNIGCRVANGPANAFTVHHHAS